MVSTGALVDGSHSQRPRPLVSREICRFFPSHLVDLGTTSNIPDRHQELLFLLSSSLLLLLWDWSIFWICLKQFPWNSWLQPSMSTGCVPKRTCHGTVTTCHGDGAPFFSKEPWAMVKTLRTWHAEELEHFFVQRRWKLTYACTCWSYHVVISWSRSGW